MAESYLTVEKCAQEEFIERRSRFIGYCRPVSTEREAVDFINEIRAKHWDATHNVYAYSLREGQTRRYSDDGEPSGTAGIPVLEILQKSAVTDTVIVVTRYFGGVLLGTGGLVRAYSQAAKLALEASGVIKRSVFLLCSLNCAYNQYGRAAAIIPECGGVIDNTEYTDSVNISFHLPPEELGLLNKKLADATSGEVCAVTEGEAFFTE